MVTSTPTAEAEGLTGTRRPTKEAGGARGGDWPLSVRRSLACGASSKLGSGGRDSAESGVPAPASMNLSAAEMLLTVAGPTVSDLMIVAGVAAEEAGVIAVEESP